MPGQEILGEVWSIRCVFDINLFMTEGNWRRRDLDRGKTLGVLLVVLGHIVARQDPAGPGWGAIWYEPLRAALYSFHIPFLFFLSGYAVSWSGAVDATGRAYRSLLGRRARRWLVPALLFSLAVTAGKWLLARHMPVDHVPASLGAGLMALVWQTDESPAQSVWYLIVLFAFAATLPVLRRLTGGRTLPLFVLSVLLMPLPLPAVLYADRFLLNLPFYIAGIMAAEADGRWCQFLDRSRRALLLVFLALLPVLMAHTASWPRPCSLAVGSVFAIPALHALVRGLWLPALTLLDRLAPFAFAIYLLNTIFIGLAKAFLLQILPWTAAAFPLFAPLLMTAGVLGPVAAQRTCDELRLITTFQRRA
jgi:fucose 4-O-acetylase-like acetyltransferase